MITTRIFGSYGISVFTAILTFVSALDVVQASDTEAFAPQNVVSRRPNVLFLVDSTLTLGAATSTPKYDPSTTYSSYLKKGACSFENTAYFDQLGTPDCTLKKPKVGALPIAKLYCDAVRKTELETVGFLDVKLLEKKVDNKGKVTWLGLTTNYPNASGDVYCENSGLAGAPLQADFNNVASTTRLFWSNKLNYDTALPYLPPEPGASRMDKLKDSLEFISKKYKDQINIGMMRTSTSGAQAGGGSGSGGMVVFPIRPMDAPAMYGKVGTLPYHDGTPDGDATTNTTLDDFIWTLRSRVACTGPDNQNCQAEPAVPAAATCGPLGNGPCSQVMAPNGAKKPLAEMLYEAYLYFAGVNVMYGTRSFVDPNVKFNSVRESIANPDDSNGLAKYLKPSSSDCQNNYIILLTDGISEGDVSNDSDIRKLVESLPEDTLSQGGYKKEKGGWTFPTNSWSSNSKAPSEYIDDLAFYLRHANASSDPPMPTTGVKTFAVGFSLGGSPDEADASQLLQDIAESGGTGNAVFANDPEKLSITIDDIIKTILAGNTAFSAPSVTINAFNRTQNLNDLYMAVFRPEQLRRWKGNLKKYTVDPASGRILDIREDPSRPAVDDTTGFFAATSQSLWADKADGELAPQGGAGSQLPAPDARTILTDDSESKLVSLATFAADLNLGDKRSVFGIAGSIPDASVPTETTTLVNWLYGADTYDESPVGSDKDQDGFFDDGNGLTDDDKLLLGDPLHSRPAVVVYGRTDDETGKPDQNDAIVYITTNEGLLHAIDTRSGVEKWAFAPQELLSRLTFLRDRTSKVRLEDRNDPRLYGLDGSVKVLRIDRDGDGPIEKSKGDRVLLFFGMRRGGGAYYGFDVTDPDKDPVMLWRTDLPDDAQSWSNPTVGEWVRVNIDGVSYGSKNGFNNALPQNRYVIVVGGGFDVSNDTKGFSRDLNGNKIYMLDVASGAILWSAGPTGGPTESLELTRMQHSIVADIRVVDLSGDNFADRMYAADLGGQVWRFDIANGKKAADLVSGGVIASVGGEDTSIDRRFYYAPDVAEVRCSGRVFYNVAIGSGDRENPVNDKSVSNAFFSFRDYLARTPVDTANYKSDCSSTTDPCFETIFDDPSQLVNVSEELIPAIDGSKAGWKLNLVGPGVPPELPETADGEKALAESRTFANGIYFTTYTPQERDKGDCGTSVGVNRLYVVNACNANPVNNFHSEVDSKPTDDRWEKLAQGSIAPEVVFIFPTPPESCKSRDCMPPPQCLVGLAGCGRGVANNPVRVFWRERGAE